MRAINATEVRKNWSEVIDQVIRKKPLIMILRLL